MSTRYTVTERGGCRLVSGSIPLTSFSMLTKGLPKKAVMDSHAARVLGVSYAMGLAEDLKALCEEPDVIQAAYERARERAPGLGEDALRWIALGKHGRSSMTLFQRLTGVRLTHDEGQPGDTADFGRCRLLLEEVPSIAGRWDEIAAISPAWSGLVKAWGRISEEMDREAPEWRKGVGSSPRALAELRAAMA